MAFNRGLSYVIDWIIIIVFLVAFLLIEYVATPNNHQSWGMSYSFLFIHCSNIYLDRNDISISQKHYEDETIPTYLLILLTCIQYY